jgi:uncharacterized protein YdaU (DUF1376 family)
MAKKEKKTNGKDPAVLLYTQDFIVGTITMTHEERGKYIMLLCLQHQKGRLTLNDLRQYITDEDTILAEKFPMHEDGFYYNDRMQMEIENRKIRTDSSRENGAKGGRPKTSIKPNDIPNTNLNKTHRLLVGIPNNNPIENGNGNGSEDVNGSENVIVNELDDHLHNTNTNTNIANKIVNNLIQYSNEKLHKDALEDLEELGGIHQVAKILDWDESVLKNHIRAINNAIQIIQNK